MKKFKKLTVLLGLVSIIATQSFSMIGLDAKTKRFEDALGVSMRDNMFANCQFDHTDQRYTNAINNNTNNPTDQTLKTGFYSFLGGRSPQVANGTTGTMVCNGIVYKYDFAYAYDENTYSVAPVTGQGTRTEVSESGGLYYFVDTAWLKSIGVTDAMYNDPANNVTAIRNAIANANPNVTNVRGEDRRVENVRWTQNDLDQKANKNADNLQPAHVTAYKDRLGITTGGVDNFLKADGSNLTDTGKTNLTNTLSNGADVNNPTGALVTDTIAKNAIDNANKLKADGSNFNYDNVNTTVKDNLATTITNTIPKGDVVSNTLSVTNGNDRLFGTNDMRVELNSDITNKIDSKLDTNLYNTINTSITNLINTKADINGSNITTDQDKQDFRNNLDVYSKDDVDRLAVNNTTNNFDVNDKDNKITGSVVKNYADNNLIGGDDTKAIFDAINKSQNDISKLDNRLNAVDSGIASIGAMATLTQITDNQDGQLTVGVGGFGGNTTYALGYSGRSDEGRVTYKASVGLTSNAVSTYGAGISYNFYKDKAGYTNINSLDRQINSIKHRIEKVKQRVY